MNTGPENMGSNKLAPKLRLLSETIEEVERHENGTTTTRTGVRRLYSARIGGRDQLFYCAILAEYPLPDEWLQQVRVRLHVDAKRHAYRLADDYRAEIHNEQDAPDV